MNRFVKNIFLLTAILILLNVNLFAQKDTIITQEVEVTKAYRPSISDAFKINDIPKIEEEEHQKPTFDYNISSQPIFSTFSVNTLQAAKITGKPKEDNGYGLIKLGAGTYMKPYAEFFLNNTGSNNTLFGLYFKHLSSSGKLKLAGGDKVNAPFSDNTAEMFVKRNFRDVNLSFIAAYDRDAFNYYGYPVNPVPSQLLEADQQINYFGTKQAFSKGAFYLSVENSSKSVSAPKLGFDLNYHYFTTKTAQKEHNAEFIAHVSKRINNLTAKLDAGAEFYQVDSVFNSTTMKIGKRQEIWFKANPTVKLENKTANIRLGGKFYVVLDKDNNPAIRVAPDVLLNITPIKGILSFFAGIDGKYEHNTYSNIAYQNPFVDPTHDVKNSMHQYRFFGGFNGKFSLKTNYKISAEYSSIKGQPFYYLQSFYYSDAGAFIVDNDFKVLYDDLGLTKFNIEVYHTASEKLNLLLTGNYYSYNTKEQTSAWNMPAFDAKLSIGYQATDRLNLSTEVFVIGERKGLIREFNNLSASPLIHINKSYTMDMVIDLNAKGTYSITHDFSAFIQLNNFGFQRYERWLGYPVQSFNFLGGISYSF